jgi:hypothetical protein
VNASQNRHSVRLPLPRSLLQKCHALIRLGRSAARAHRHLLISRYSHELDPQAVLRVPVTRVSPLFHHLGAERVIQRNGVIRLRGPVAERVHVHA